MKKFFKWFFIVIVALLVLLAIVGFIVHESRPEGTPSPEADTTAQKMMEAVNLAAWDTTNIISWDFDERQQYLWDKSRHFVKVMWGENMVLLHTKTVSGKAYKNGKEVTGEEGDKLIQKAWSHFCNDSFWLNAIVKVFDPGTSRSLIKTSGEDALLVSYDSGGVTPGDAYAWVLDENNLPKYYKMWVDIIPIGGLEFTWDKWITLDTGAKIATFHKNTLLSIDMKDVKGSVSLAAHGINEDPFAVLEQ